MHGLQSPFDTSFRHRYDDTFRFSSRYTRIPQNTSILRWNTHSTSFCTGTSCKCISSSGQRRECPWRTRGFGSWRFASPGRFSLSFRPCFCNIHRYSFHCKFSLWRNTRNTVLNSLSWCICILASKLFPQITWPLETCCENCRSVLLMQDFRPIGFQKGLFCGNFRWPLTRCQLGWIVMVP